MMPLLETLLEESRVAISHSRNNVPRDISFPVSENLIKVAIGMRRTGKTHFLYQCINQLLNDGVLPSQILMINFEDDRLLPMNAKEMGNLIDAFFFFFSEKD